MATERYEVRRTVDSCGSTIAGDQEHRGLVVGSAADCDSAQQIAREDYDYHARANRPIGPGTYYILDTESGEELQAEI